MIHDFIVLGAGASGLFFAATRGLALDNLTSPSSGNQNARRGSAKHMAGGKIDGKTGRKMRGASSISGTLGVSGKPGMLGRPGVLDASGISEAGNTASVLLLEHQERPGRKLLLSGGGKCNLTNLSVRPENYLCADVSFCRHALAAFTPRHLLDLARRHGIELEEREHGQMFCRRGAEELRDLLLALATANGAGLLTGQRIERVSALHQGWEFAPGGLANSGGSGKAGGNSISRPGEWSGHGPADVTAAENAPRFAVQSNGKIHLARNLLVATGNKAWPRSGSSVLGLDLARSCGHSVIPLRPGLTPLKMPPGWPLHGLQGLSVTARVTAVGNGPDERKPPAFILPLLFTHHGLSGPACLQASSYLALGGANETGGSGRAGGTDEFGGPGGSTGPGGRAFLEVDFAPDINLSALLDDPSGGKASLQSILRKHLPERLLNALLSSAGLDEIKSRRVAELSRAARNKAVEAVHRHRVKPEPPGYGQAESTVGGVNTAEINPATMESRLCPGLYFTGEVLDVCGQLGGYNLHWAWASAWLAGRG